MKFDNLQLSVKELKSIIQINDKEVEIKHYLPIEQKNNLIQLAIQQSTQVDGFINDILFDTFLNLYIVFFYTNLEFTDEQKQNPLNTYDVLQSNGLIGKIAAGIPKEEYEEVFYAAETYLEQVRKYQVSTVALVNTIMNTIPAQMEKVGEIINNFDPAKYQAVVDFATAANGGRNINTNQPVEVKN